MTVLVVHRFESVQIEKQHAEVTGISHSRGDLPVEFAAMHIPLSVNRPGDGSIVVRDGATKYVLRGGIAAWNSEVLKTQHPTLTTIYFAPLRRHGC